MASSSSLEIGELTLPFDQYQRYKIVQEIISTLRWKNQLRILDVGGHPGNIRHFLKRDEIYVLDRRMCCIPNFILGEGQRLPFHNEAFDVVVCLDVLEHIPPVLREDFFSELLRVSKSLMILGGPFLDEKTSQAEKIVYDFIRGRYGIEYDLLLEHFHNGLPELSKVCSLFEEHGCSHVALPNGYLYHWLFMLLVHFSLEWMESSQSLLSKIHTFYNQNFYKQDNREPSYRKVIVASKKGKVNLTTLLSDIIKDVKGEEDANQLHMANIFLQMLNLQEIRKKEEALKELKAIKDEVESRLSSELRNMRESLVRTEEDMKALERLKNETSQKLSQAMKDKENLSAEMDNLGKEFFREKERLLTTQGELADKVEILEKTKDETSQCLSDALKDKKSISDEIDSLRLAYQVLEKERNHYLKRIISIDSHPLYRFYSKMMRVYRKISGRKMPEE